MPASRSIYVRYYNTVIALGGGEDFEEEGVVPGGAFELAPSRALVRVGAQEVEGEAAQAGEVLGA